MQEAANVLMQAQNESNSKQQNKNISMDHSTEVQQQNLASSSHNTHHSVLPNNSSKQSSSTTSNMMGATSKVEGGGTSGVEFKNKHREDESWIKNQGQLNLDQVLFINQILISVILL